MSWLSWILAYLFDCVHRHTTWPRRHRAGFAYVACLNCGRELPYSLDRMRIVTRVEQMGNGVRGKELGTPRDVGVETEQVGATVSLWILSCHFIFSAHRESFFRARWFWVWPSGYLCCCL